MNQAQRMWWRQAQSDLQVFERLRRAGVAPCHLLHYLQMATEKLAKAYLWRSGTPPPKTHVGFIRFLRALVSRGPAREQHRIARELGFNRAQDFETWEERFALAYDLQNLAPAEANNGPNPEYPWPHDNPAHCPADTTFALWPTTGATGRMRKLVEFIGTAVNKFDAYA